MTFSVSIYTTETHAGCNTTICIATAPFFHETNPKTRTFARLCDQLTSGKLNLKIGACP